MEESWRDVAGFEELYKINRNGTVVNKKSGKVLKGTVCKWEGYVKCNLFVDGKSNSRLVHRLVALAFIPNPDNLPMVHHKDGNKQNNSVENLEWVSSKTHGAKMTPEQRAKIGDTRRKNLEARKKFSIVL